MTDNEKRAVIVKAVHELVEAEKLATCMEDHATSVGQFANAIAAAARATETFNAACDAVFGVAGESFCYCNPDIRLDSVAGGANKAGLYGTVHLRIGNESVEYARVKSSPAVVSSGVKKPPANIGDDDGCPND